MLPSRWNDRFWYDLRTLAVNFSAFVQGSRHLTDLGLTTLILTGLTSLSQAYWLFISSMTKKLAGGSSLVATLIYLNPGSFNVLVSRFDSPYMALSIFLFVSSFLLVAA